MARPKSREGREELRATVPRPLYFNILTLCANPLTGQPIYGALSHLVTGLLKEWLERFNAAPDKIAELERFGIDCSSLRRVQAELADASAPPAFDFDSEEEKEITNG